MNNVRKATNLLLQAIDDGLLTSDYVLTSLLLHLSEHEVAEFYQDFLREGHDEYLPALDQKELWYNNMQELISNIVMFLQGAALLAIALGFACALYR